MQDVWHPREDPEMHPQVVNFPSRPVAQGTPEEAFRPTAVHSYLSIIVTLSVEGRLRGDD